MASWTDCPLIEQVPGKLSGAPVIKRSRVRPEDLLANLDQGSEWLADAYSLPLEQVRDVLAFFEANCDTLPRAYISPERRKAELSASAV